MLAPGTPSRVTLAEVQRAAHRLRAEVDRLLSLLPGSEDTAPPESSALLDALRRALHATDDLVTRPLRLTGLPVRAVAYLESLVDLEWLQRTLATPHPGARGDRAPRHGEAALLARPVPAEVPALVDHLLAGRVVFLGDGTAWALDGPGPSGRQPDEPQSERLIQGPREGFVERLDVNLGMIRVRLRTPDLVVRRLVLGRRSRTRVAVVYVEGTTPPEVVAQLLARLQRYAGDTVLGSGYLTQWLEDRPHSPFPQFWETERPDRVVGNLAAGRVAVLVDGDPFALIGPVTFAQSWQTPEDYNQRWLAASFARGFRVLAAWVSLVLPSLYISFVAFHPEMIPTTLVLPIAAARAGVPLPTIGEALFLEFAVEVLREASIRLPRTVGPTISIVGGLIIGEAVVQANLVSPLVVIVVSVTAIGSFVAPIYSAAAALRLLRFPLMLAAATLGLYGVMLGLIAILIHVSDVRSLERPYAGPLPLQPPRDVPFWRAPLPVTQRGEEGVRHGA